MASVRPREHTMDRVVMQLSELVDVMQPVIDKQDHPTALKPHHLYLEDAFGKAAVSDPCEPRPSHLLQKVSGILTRAIKRMQRMDEMYKQSESWKVIQEVDAFKALMKDLKMYLTMLGVAPSDENSGTLPGSARADTGTAHGRSGAAASLRSSPRKRATGGSAAERRGAAAAAVGAKMAQREQDLSVAASKLAPVQRPSRAGPEDRPPQPVAALPSTLPHGLAADMEGKQEPAAPEGPAAPPDGDPANLVTHPSTSGPRVALQDYADVADLPFIPTIAKRSNPVTVSESDGASSLAPPGTSRAVMEIKEDVSRALSAQHAAAASLAAARSARDALSMASGTPNGSTGTAQRNPLSSRTPPGTLGDGDSAPFLCSSPRGAEQLFLHKSPSHHPGGPSAKASAAPDALAAARQSYALDHNVAAALPRRPGTATAAHPTSAASAATTTTSAATAPPDLSAAAAALQLPPPRHGLQPQPVSRPALGSTGSPLLYGKLSGPSSANPGSPVGRQPSAASVSTSASSGHKLQAFRLRPPQPPPAPTSPARRPNSRTSSHKLPAFDDFSQKLGSVSVSGSAMSATAVSTSGAMAGMKVGSMSGMGGMASMAEPAARHPVPQQSGGCFLTSLLCRGTRPQD
eukprot:jgi/Ulvmu1/643/UM010_0013.1